MVWPYSVYSKKMHPLSYLRNASNTHSNTHFSTHSLWLVKIHMGPTKSCGSHIILVGLMQILTNQRECFEKCVLECVLLAFLLLFIHATEAPLIRKIINGVKLKWYRTYLPVQYRMTSLQYSIYAFLFSAFYSVNAL